MSRQSTDTGRNRLRKGDLVQVIAGREKGKTGKVLSFDAANARVRVEKINLLKKHVRASQKNPGGGWIEKEGVLDRSNVLLFCPKCNRGVRHGVRVGNETKGAKSVNSPTRKARYCKRCEGALDPA